MKQYRATKLCCTITILLLLFSSLPRPAMVSAHGMGFAVLENVQQPPSDLTSIKNAAQLLKDFKVAMLAAQNPDEEQVEAVVSAQLAVLLWMTIINEASDELFDGIIASFDAESHASEIWMGLSASLQKLGRLLADSQAGEALTTAVKAGIATFLRFGGRLPGAFYFIDVDQAQGLPVDHKLYFHWPDRLEKYLKKAAAIKKEFALTRPALEFVVNSADYSRKNLLSPVSFFFPVAASQKSEHSYFELLPADAVKNHSYLLLLAALQSITGKLVDSTGFEIDAHADSIREQNAALREYQAKLPLALNISRALLQDKNANLSARGVGDADALARFFRSFMGENVRRTLQNKFRDGHVWGEVSAEELFSIDEFSQSFKLFLRTGPLALSSYYTFLGQAQIIARLNSQLIVALNAVLAGVEKAQLSSGSFDALNDTVKAWYLMTVDEIKDSIKVLNGRNEKFACFVDPDNVEFCGGVFGNYRADTSRIAEDLRELNNIHANFDYISVDIDFASYLVSPALNE